MPKSQSVEGKRSRHAGRTPFGLSPAHEDFCRGVAEGLGATGAYRKYVATSEETQYSTCQERGCRLMADDKIQARIAQLKVDFRTFLEKKLGVSREYLARYMHDALETPAGELTADNRLCQQVTPGKFGVTLSMVDKEQAAKLLANLAGYQAPTEVNVSGDPEVTLALAQMFGTGKGNKAKAKKKGKRK